MPSHLITHEGQALLIADLDGLIGGGIAGFYYRQTRYLSKMRFAVDGIAPLAVSANPVSSYSSIAYYLAAGIPKYAALFGRDVLMTAFQASLPAPAMMRESLGLIAKWNATKYDKRYDEEPGRIIHQRQLSPLALLEKNPFLHYYCDYSAPGLFLIDLAWDLALTGDNQFFLSMRDKALQTLEWMDRDGDRDGDVFYEYTDQSRIVGREEPGLEGFWGRHPLRRWADARKPGRCG